MKTVDLSKLKIEMIDGSIMEYDLSKELAEVIFKTTQSLAEHSFCLDLYKNPIVELTDENKAIIEKYVSQYFKAFVQVAVNKLLSDENN
jgi:hypothetical protein